MTSLPPLKPGDFKFRRGVLVAVCAEFGYSKGDVAKLLRAGLVHQYALPAAPRNGKSGRHRAPKERGHYLASDVAAALGQPTAAIVALAKGKL